MAPVTIPNPTQRGKPMAFPIMLIPHGNSQKWNWEIDISFLKELPNHHDSTAWILQRNQIEPPQKNILECNLTSLTSIWLFEYLNPPQVWKFVPLKKKNHFGVPRIPSFSAVPVAFAKQDVCEIPNDPTKHPPNVTSAPNSHHGFVKWVTTLGTWTVLMIFRCFPCALVALVLASHLIRLDVLTSWAVWELQPIQEKIRAAFNWVSSACRNSKVTSCLRFNTAFCSNNLFLNPRISQVRNHLKSSRSSNPTHNFQIVPDVVLPPLNKTSNNIGVPTYDVIFLFASAHLRSLRGKACENHSVHHQIPTSHQVDQQENQWLRRTWWSSNNTTWERSDFLTHFRLWGKNFMGKIYLGTVISKKMYFPSNGKISKS